MTSRRPSRSLALPLVPCLVAACAAGPAWTEAERRELQALQQAVLTKLAVSDAELSTPAMVTLPEGKDLDDVDVFLHVFPSVRLEEEGFQQAWSIGPNHPLPGRAYRDERRDMLAIVGHTIDDLTPLFDFTVDRTRGAVLLASRRGQQTVVTQQGIWCGSLWHPSFCPEVSRDGSHFTFVEDGWFGDRAMLSPTATPERAIPVELPGVVQWPVWPGRDGTQPRSIVVVDGRVEVRIGDRVVATGENFAHPFFDQELDELQVHLTIAGKQRVLLGEQLLPPLDGYRWIDRSRDGRHHLAAGHEGGEQCVVYDGHVVLRCQKLAWMDLADDGSTWACAVQAGEEYFLVRPGSRSGPLPEVTQLVLAPDGSSLAVCTRQGRQWSWTLDGQPLGAAYERLHDVMLLPRRAGAVFTAADAKGSWLVAPGSTDGPWDRVAHVHRLADGKHVVALAQRGREAHRRVLPLP